MTIKVTRRRKTEDGIFGFLTLEENPFSCFTVENLALAMPIGTYPITFSYSPHFNRQMPHFIVPGHTDTMFHWANYPVQLKGCIAVGDKEEPDAIDNSISTFNRFNAIIIKMDDLKLEITEAYA